MKASCKTLLAAGMAAALLLTSGCSLLPLEEEPLQPPLVKPVKESLDTYEVKRGTIAKQVRGSGTYESTKLAYHQFTENGARVRSVLVKAGDEVKPGDILVQLDLDELDVQLKQRQLELEKAKLAADQAKASGDSQDAKLKAMEYDIKQMQVEQTRKKIENRTLRATIAGQVTFVDKLQPGDLATAYKPIVIVADPHVVRLSMSLSNPNEAADLSVGMEATLKKGNVTYKGVVVQTPSSAPRTEDKQEQEKNAKTVYVEPVDKPDDVKMGENVDILITTKQKEDTIVIPARGLRSYFNRFYVQVLDGESRKEVDVEKGLETGSEVEIVKGLKEGQTIILQ
ncbi:macrolide transporter subunit MacA [Paenibacillus sp. J31TS4]|uniref:efflux RND transporter periplasmic adaptor subunit n=1 Tax=Paenibacillus sp. J31TS4 TaxID=2807195 RepID=UPI001B138603|nr:biotin/lipoyl-binding protein [Paenibacillus sp. J31TS4]GIP37658.1 macrolide transporter subunit MacA [Paenibacillus sp. J31TS4]